MPQGDDAVTRSKVTASSSSRRRRPLIVLLLAVALIVLARGIFFETFTVPSGSMEPTLSPGDRIVVWKFGDHPVQRGEVIVFNGTDAFDLSDDRSGNAVIGVLRSVGDAVGFRTGEVDFVKRVIGLPGDTVSVDDKGVLRVDGTVVREPYLPRGMKASKVPFHVTVPRGRLFVMGDNRPDSQDSRSHLGSPGGGTVPLDDVIGTVVLRYWPIGSWGRLPS